MVNIETSKTLLLNDDSKRKLSNERMSCILRARNVVVNDMCSGTKMSFPVRVSLLTMFRGRLSVVIARLMPNVYEEGRGGRQELELPSPSSLFVKVKRKKAEENLQSPKGYI